MRRTAQYFALMLACCVQAWSQTPHTIHDARLPVAVSPNGRYLVDQSGAPFLVHGDSAWALLAALSWEDATQYLEDRRQRGVNAIIANLLEHKFAPHAPRNFDGAAPFMTPGDFSKPNEAYFRHADRVLRLAEEKGQLVFLFPCYWGYDGGDEGFWKELITNSPAACREYGRFLGRRYRHFANIIWVHGGDYSPPDDASGVALGLEILHGIRETDPAKLHSFHGKRSTTARDHAAFAPHVDIDAVYCGDEIGRRGPAEIYRLPLLAYNRPQYRPTLLLEARYENDMSKQNEALGVASRQRLRRQPYCAILSGTTGHFFGNNPVWKFATGWDGPSGIGSQGNTELVHVREAFATRAWHQLVPDEHHRTVVAGYGTFGALDYVVSGRAEDGGLLMAYVPSTGIEARTLTADLSRITGPAQARWFNPVTGAYAPIAGSPFANTGRHDFTTPGDNGTGTNDWLLVIEATSPPG